MVAMVEERMTAALSRDPLSNVLPLLQQSTWPGAGAARQALAALPVPTQRTEAWKYTRVAKLFNRTYTAPDRHAGVELPDRLPFPATRLVFVNGHFRADLSDDLKADKGVVVDSIAHHLGHGPLQAHITDAWPRSQIVSSPP